jgi:hypothetical protein
MADRTLEKEGRQTAVFRPKDDDDERGEITVFVGTGLWDALRTEPDYELVTEVGDVREAPPKTKAETGPKTDMVPDPTLLVGEAEKRTDLNKLDRSALESKAADVGVKDADRLGKKADLIDAIIVAERQIRGQAAPA